jgi:hypothetical protein
LEEDKCEKYLIELKLSYSCIGPSLWRIDEPEHKLVETAVAHVDPLVIISTAVMELPETAPEKRLELFTELLTLNGNGLVHGAYGLENGQIILVDTLEYAAMDFSEFRASLEAFSLALSQHYPVLSKYR